MNNNDIIIIGSGIAALTAAERLSINKNVIIFTKSTIKESNSYYAQGGIAVAIDQADHWEAHFRDTLIASCAHGDIDHTQKLIENGPNYMQTLIDSGMEFDRDHNGNLKLAMEGAHLRRRILHSGGDATGKVLIDFIYKKIADKVTFIENEMAIDLIIENGQCTGILVKHSDGSVLVRKATAVILATGGCGALYQYTSNRDTITGDGMAMAYRAGAELVDMEFVQFHPTILSKNDQCFGLVSEAVRGEGGYLVNQDGVHIMEGIHPLKDLAPRDIVARAIFNATNNGEKVYLNISKVTDFASRFPTIAQMAKRQHIDIGKALLPVIPGAHFMMGGIKSSPTGQTSIPGLFAVGEVACTGVHGANRIASNSLLEGIVFGNMTAESILAFKTEEKPVQISAPIPTKIKYIPNLPKKQELREKMMLYTGVSRSEINLKKMLEWLTAFDYLNICLINLSSAEIEIVNMLTVAQLITTAALERTESKGSHYRSDFPNLADIWHRIEIIQSISDHSISLNVVS